MNSILQFDDKFESLTGLLRRSPWLVLKVRIVNELLSLVNNLPEDCRGMYLWELTPYLRDVFSHIHPGNPQTAAIDPHIIYSLMKNAIPLIPDEELLRGVQKVLLTAYLRLNAFDLFFKRASCWKFTFDPVDYKKILTRLPVELSGLEQKKWSLDHLKHNITGELKESLNHLQLNLSSGNTIKGLFAVSAGKFIDGMVASITLNRVQVNRGESIDHVRISTHLVDEKDVLADQTKGMCEWLRRRYPRLKGHWIRLEYSLDQPSSLLVGNSLGLAMAQLADMELSRYGKNPSHEARIYSDVAMTGAMEEDGFVSSVDPESLKYKIHAAFFSGIRSVVIPDAQEGLVKKTVEELNRKWPFGKIKPLPVKNIASIKEHRSVLFHQRRRTSNRIRQFIKTYANSVTYAILGFIVLCAVLFYVFIVKNPEPYKITTDGVRYIISNKFNFKLWETPIIVSNDILINDTWIEKVAKISDLNNDGKKEILIGYGSLGPIPTLLKNRLICYDSKGNTIWSVKLGKEISYGGGAYPDNFSANMVLINDLDEDGNYELICKAASLYFPTRILILNGQGELITDYWHCGRLTSMEVAEVYDGNNTKEVILSGTNNEKNQGILAVIDPFKISGSSPQRDLRYVTSDVKDGNEIYYIRFPSSPFKNHFGKNMPGDMAVLRSVLEDNKINVHVTSGVSTIIKSYFRGIVTYYFDFDLNFIDVGLNDSYYPLYKEVFPNRERLPYGAPDLISRLKEVEYWNGDNWVKETTVNRRYLESLEKVQSGNSDRP